MLLVETNDAAAFFFEYVGLDPLAPNSISSQRWSKNSRKLANKGLGSLRDLSIHFRRDSLSIFFAIFGSISDPDHYNP